MMERIIDGEPKYKLNLDPFALVHNGSIIDLHSLIKSGLGVNSCNEDNISLLKYAVDYRQVGIAKLLISYGADTEVLKDEASDPDVLVLLDFSNSEELKSQYKMNLETMEVEPLGCCIIS